VCRDSSVGEVTRLRTGYPRNPLSIPNSGKIFFSFPNIPDRLWCPLSLVLSGCRERFPRGFVKKGVQLTTQSISVYSCSMYWDNNSFTYFYVPSSSVSLTFHDLLLRHFLRPILSSHSSYILLPTFRLGSHLSGYTSRNLAKNKSKCNFVHHWMCYLCSAHYMLVTISSTPSRFCEGT